VRNLLRLLLEAPLDDATAKKMLDSGSQVSVYYQGDSDSPRGWKTIEAIKVEDTKGKKYLVAYEIPKEAGKKAEIKRYQQDKIVNWNILGKKSRTIDVGPKTAKSKTKKEPPTTPPTVKKRNLGGKGDDICDAITNKRFVKLYYQGDEEEAPGWRTDVQPVAYGSKKGIKYVRAWVGSGKSVSADKNPQKKALPGWRFFREDRIKTWDVDATKTFKTPPRADFNPKGDKLMDSIFCISDFSQDDSPKSSLLQESSILSVIKDAIKIF